MATQVQFRRGNTAQTNAFTGAVAEITIDTDKETIVVHDGSTAGGFPLARESALSTNLTFTQAAFNAANAAGSSATVQAAFDKANSANVLAQAAFDAANTVSPLDSYARTTANTASANTVVIQGVDATQNTNITIATNAEAVTITKGQAVYAFGATGNRVSVKLANNTGDATSAKTFGLAAEDITAGGTGMIICQGVLDGLDTSAYTAGDSLYLGATNGALTATKPYAPNHLVYIGTVERANAGNGQIYVRVQNGYEIDELHNVSAQNPTNGQILIYNETTSLWEKANITAGSNITITNGAGSITIASTGGGGGSGDGGAYAWFLS